MINETENKKINTKKEALKLLSLCLEESNGPATFYDAHAICKSLKISAPKLDLIFDKLKNEGYLTTKTHYNPLGIKCDAKINEIKNILNNLSK